MNTLPFSDSIEVQILDDAGQNPSVFNQVLVSVAVYRAIWELSKEKSGM